ncbi:ABC transporter substrate binding protein [Comamonas endophytica]|uniref:ABC transporter substrate binding protein n=1 Tax=Comamonas endophytica TaxID=2949090 RepID=UPI00361C9FC9
MFTEVTDPVNAGLIKNLAHPERNITGVSHVAPLDVQFNAIQAYRPFRRIGYLHNPAEPNSLGILRGLQAHAQRQGLQVIEASLGLDAHQEPDPAQIAPLVADIAARGADLLYVGPITFLAFTHRDAVTQAARQHRLPTFCATESIVRRSGCLFGLFSNDTNVGRFAGAMAHRILVERKPVSAVAASTLQRFSLLVNLPVAQALELYPPMLLLNVAEVIPVAPVARTR